MPYIPTNRALYHEGKRYEEINPQVTAVLEGQQVTMKDETKGYETKPFLYDTFVRWIMGQGHIQDMFPELDANDREFLLSGTTPSEWKAMFGR